MSDYPVSSIYPVVGALVLAGFALTVVAIAVLVGP
jgi:hypothetical protein